MPEEGLIHATAKDVTESRQAEHELRSSEQFLDSVLENLPSMVFAKDAEELRYVRLNRSGEELLGRSRDELIGKNDHDVLGRREADFSVGKDREVLASGEDIAEEPIEPPPARAGQRGARHLAESGTMSMSLEPVHLGSVLAEALSLIRPLADEVQVGLSADAELADLHVLADQQRLKQVLINLLSNAVKYNRRGGEIDVRCSELPEGRVEVAISDTDRGMTGEQLERLFDPFDRLGAERTDVEGTGLGLPLSMALTEAMGGTIEAESEAGELILLDLHLPDLHGREVLEQLKRDPATSAIPVVMLSADATPGQIERLLAAGAEHYATKPIDVGWLHDVVVGRLQPAAAT